MSVADIQNVVNDDLCIGCGVCVPVCPEESIVPTYSEERGAYEVLVTPTAACAPCAAPCSDVCPSVEVDFPALGLPVTGRLGPIDAVFTATSVSTAHPRASSGGIVRVLIHDALERGVPVVCLADRLDGAGHEVARLTEGEETTRLPGSVYHATDFTQMIARIVESPRRVLLVALPCHLEGLKKYEAVTGQRISDNIELVVGIICGWMFSDHAVRAFASFKRLSGRIDAVSYRGGEKVGRLRVLTDGHEHSYSRRVFETADVRLDYTSAFGAPANRLRCRTCENHLNVLADVCVGDAWLPRLKDQKVSIVAARNQRGARAIRRLAGAGQVNLVASDVADLIQTQSVNLSFGVEARAISAQLARLEIAAPRFRFAVEDTPPDAAPRTRPTDVVVEMSLRRLLRTERYRLYRSLFGASKNPGVWRRRARGGLSRLWGMAQGFTGRLKR